MLSREIPVFGLKQHLAESKKQDIAARAVIFVLHASKAGDAHIMSVGIVHRMAGKEIPIMPLSCHT